MHKEAVTHLLKKEQLILAFPKDIYAFKKLLGEVFPEKEELICPLPVDEFMGRVLAAWAEEKVAVVDLGSTTPPSIFKNFLSDMLLHKRATPYPYGEECQLGTHKIVVLGDSVTHGDLREYFQAVYE